MDMEFIDIGKVTNTHGVRGEIKLMPLTDNPDRYYDLDHVYIQGEGSYKKLLIENVRRHNGTIMIKFKNYDNLDDVLFLKGKYISVDRKDAVKLPEDSFFIFEIIGLSVYDTEGNFLGVIKDVFPTGSNDVYVVGDEGKKDLLLPALKSVVKEVDIGSKKMTVCVPDGLYDEI